jgi:hypothetical protein
MKGFIIKTKDNQIIRFKYYNEAAPVTISAFDEQLPFTRTFIHARVSGQEFWIDNAPELNIIQENASVFTVQGEVVIGTLKPTRTKTSKCMGIYYGEGKGLDCCNIFGKVFDEDLSLLKDLGDKIWRQGEQELTFEKLF